jgi:hypothetical protein
MSKLQFKLLVIQIICAHDGCYSTPVTMLSLEDVFYFLILILDLYKLEPNPAAEHILACLLATAPLESDNLDCYSVLKHSKLYRTGSAIATGNPSFVKFPCVGISKTLYRIAGKYPLNPRLHKLFNHSVWLGIKLRLLKYKLLRYVYFSAAQRGVIDVVLDYYLLRDSASFERLKLAAEAVNSRKCEA